MDHPNSEKLPSRQGRKLKSLDDHDQLQKEERTEALEVSVSTLENLGSTPVTSTALRRGVTKTRLLKISPSGSCTVQDAPSLEPAANQKATASSHRKSLTTLHNPFPSIGKFKGTAEDKLLECILWLKKRGTDKDVKASKDVLAMYHDAFLYAKVPLTIKVRAAIRGGVLRPLLIWLEFTAALISVIVYVRSTYIINVPAYIPIVETVCGVFFLVDYFVNLYSAPVRLYYMFSATGIVDLVSVIPVAFVWSRERNFGVEILLFLRVLRIMPMLTSVGLTGATIGQQIFRLVVYAFGVIFIAAGLLQWVDYRGTTAQFKEANGCSPKGCITFFGAFYFMIVTISTVGYGDITPRSDWGRVIAILAIVTALIILPVQVNNVLQLASRRPYGGYFAVNKVVGSRFIIVSGNLSFRTVQDFLSEFYHPNHDKDMAAFPLRMVLMAPFKPSFELKTLLAHYKAQVEFIQGSPLKDSDLDRVGAKVASAIFLLANQHTQDPDAEDATQLLRTLAVHRHNSSNMRVFVELLKPEKRTNAIWDDADQDIEIICPEAIRFKLLSRSCHIQGLSTFVVNLFRQGLKVSKPEKGSWLRQYYHGLKQEVFPVLLPAHFHKEELWFEEVAELVYHRLGVILFGLDVVNNITASREVILFPKGRVIAATDVGMVVAKNLEVAKRVSTFGKDGKEGCQYMKSSCSNCKTRSELNDFESLHDVKSKRYKSGSKEEKMDEYKITIPSGEEMKRDRRMSNPTQELLESVSNLQSHFHNLHSSSLDSTNVDTREATSEPHQPQHIKSLKELDTREATSEPHQPQHIKSLEEAIDLAMSWPPLNGEYKPDPPVLDRRASEILGHLTKHTLSMVKLNVPHILVCMQGEWPVNLFYFFSHCRAIFPSLIPIVILHPNEPTTREWGCVGMFKEVYFVQGSPIYELDLVRAGVLQAMKVVILTSRSHFDEHGEVANDAKQVILAPGTSTQDVNNIIIAASVERLLKPARERIIVELQQEATFQYLRPKLFIDERQFFSEMYQRNRVGTFQFAPPYIEGKTFCPQTLTFLMYASFFNRSTVSIVEQLISGGKVLCDNSKGYQVRVLDQIAIPKPYVSQTYGMLFTGLLRRDGMLALGLYRPMNAHGSLVSYVFTNPPPHEPLELNDLVYILH